MADEVFDWGELGPDWWADIGRQTGASERQLKFACAQLRGCSQTNAAREAGYPTSNEASLRQTGYRLARSNMVQRLFAFAHAEKGGTYDGTVDQAETKRILSTLARGSDPAIRIRACESISRLAEQERQARNAEREITPEEAARGILRASPEFGAVIAADFYFQNTGTLWGLPYLAGLAPRLKANFFPAWQRYLAAIKSPDHRKALAALGDGPLLPLDQIIGPEPETANNNTEEATQ